jgi:hypothetical protein
MEPKLYKPTKEIGCYIAKIIPQKDTSDITSVSPSSPLQATAVDITGCMSRFCGAVIAANNNTNRPSSLTISPFYGPPRWYPWQCLIWYCIGGQWRYASISKINIKDVLTAGVDDLHCEPCHLAKSKRLVSRDPHPRWSKPGQFFYDNVQPVKPTGVHGCTYYLICVDSCTCGSYDYIL